MTSKTETGGSAVKRGALQVYDALREDILWLRIEPGSALDEVGLAARFKVSRTPVREALLLLSGEGFVQFLPNRTTIVAPMLLNNTGDYLDMLLILSRGAVRSAAQSGMADLEVMSEHLERCSAAVEAGDHNATLQADNRFRRYLAGLTGNMFQIKYFDQVLDGGVRSKILHYFPTATKDELRAAIANLSKLVDAVIERDVDRSDKVMTEIIHAEFAIVVRSLRPKFADEMPLKNHPVNLEAFK